jgi:hypothetical protein
MESASSPRPDHIKATLSLLYLFILGDMAFILVHALHVW